MGQDPNTVSMRERVRVVKVDLDNPEKEPEIVEQETVTQISMDTASIFGFVPGHGFSHVSDVEIATEVDSGAAVSGEDSGEMGVEVFSAHFMQGDPLLGPKIEALRYLPKYESAHSSAEVNQEWNELSRDADGPSPPIEGVDVGDE